MFAIVPVYNTSNESENRIIQLEHIEQVRPTANVAVDPGAVDTQACEAVFHSGGTITILIDMASMQTHLVALTGVIDTYGSLL